MVRNYKSQSSNLFLDEMFFVTIAPKSLIAVVTSSPMMKGENLRPHGPGVMPDDVIGDSIQFMD